MYAWSLNNSRAQVAGMRAAIVGPGRVCGEHAKAYVANNVEVVAICGRTKESAQKKIDELKLQALAYDDLEQVLAREKIDVLSICSPPELHAQQTILAARYGVHVAVEKPVALNEKELFAMDREVARAGLKSIVGFVLRWNDLVQNIKNVYQPRIGRVSFIETDYWHGSCHEKKYVVHEYGTRAKPLSAFLGGGCHAVDMAKYLASSDIVEVAAMTPWSQKNKLQRTTAAIVMFENGIVGKISASDEVFMPYVFNIALFGREGAIRLNQFYATTTQGYEIIPGTVPDSGAVWHHPFQGMIHELVDSIQNNKKTSCSIEDAVNTHLVCYAIEQSARDGGRKRCTK